MLDNGAFTATISHLKAFTNYEIVVFASNVEGPAQGTIPAIRNTTAGGVSNFQLLYLVLIF